MTVSLNIQENCSLKKFTTFGIGGPARFFLEAISLEDIYQAIDFCKKQKIPYFVLGKGSNCLFDDRGFSGMVILMKLDSITKYEDGLFYVEAGYSFSLLGSQTARDGWSGLEFASGIPGSVGGAVYMNAGANGKETADTIVSVNFLDEEGNLETIKKENLHFSYRHSSFQTKRGVIIGATFKLIKSEIARKSQLEIIHYRKKTQPYSSKSAGCVFKNPSKEKSAGALIDQSGLKGQSVGGAQVSDMHANFVVNAGQATAQNVIDLIQLIKREVKAKTGYELENEVRLIPYSSYDQDPS